MYGIVRDTGLNMAGIIAVTPNEFSAHSPNGIFEDLVGMEQEISKPKGKGMKVHVIERNFGERNNTDMQPINSPELAREQARLFYEASGNKPGILFVDNQHKPAAYVPISEAMKQKLRQDNGAVLSVYRAASEANASGFFIVHGGDLDAAVEGSSSERPRSISIAQNLASALNNNLGLRGLDIINVVAMDSAAEVGRRIGDQEMFSRNQNTSENNNEQTQTFDSGLPKNLPSAETTESRTLEDKINGWLERGGRDGRVRIRQISPVSLPDAFNRAMDRLYDATGTRVVLFRNLTPEVEDFNGVNFRDGTLYINENSEYPATLTAAHEWVHNLKRDNLKLYQEIENEVRRQGLLDAWHQRNIKIAALSVSFARDKFALPLSKRF